MGIKANRHVHFGHFIGLLVPTLLDNEQEALDSIQDWMMDVIESEYY